MRGGGKLCWTAESEGSNEAAASLGGKASKQNQHDLATVGADLYSRCSVRLLLRLKHPLEVIKSFHYVSINGCMLLSSGWWWLGGACLDSMVQCMRARMCASFPVNAPAGFGSLRSETDAFCRRVWLLAPTRTEDVEERRRLSPEHILGLLSFASV